MYTVFVLLFFTLPSINQLWPDFSTEVRLVILALMFCAVVYSAINKEVRDLSIEVILRSALSKIFLLFNVSIFVAFTVAFAWNMINLKAFASMYGELLVGEMFIFFAIAFFIAVNRMGLYDILSTFFVSMNIYLTLNVLLYVLGFEVSNKTYFQGFLKNVELTAQLPALLGIRMNRVFFPLATSINAFGTFTGLTLVGNSVILYNERKLRYLFPVFLSVFVLFAVDSRGALIFAVVALLFLVKFLQSTRLLGFLFFSLLVLPIILINIDLKSLLFFASNFARSAADFQEMGGRALIWGSFFSFYSHFDIAQLFGYGFYGHVSLKLYQGALYLLTSYANPEEITLHNSYFQYIVDTGYIGFLLFMVLVGYLVKVTDRIKLKDEKLFNLVRLPVIYLLFAGTFETCLTYYNKYTFFSLVIFILVMSFNQLALSAQSELKEDLQVGSV